MIRFISTISVAAFALISASCCCTGEPKAPSLRKLPHFQEVETTETAAEVRYEK